MRTTGGKSSPAVAVWPVGNLRFQCYQCHLIRVKEKFTLKMGHKSFETPDFRGPSCRQTGPGHFSQAAIFEEELRRNHVTWRQILYTGLSQHTSSLAALDRCNSLAMKSDMDLYEHRVPKSLMVDDHAAIICHSNCYEVAVSPLFSQTHRFVKTMAKTRQYCKT